MHCQAILFFLLIKEKQILTCILVGYVKKYYFNPVPSMPNFVSNERLSPGDMK